MGNYLYLLLEFDEDGKLDDSMTSVMTDFHIVNFPYVCSNIPYSPAYGVFVSQFACYARACSKYEDFLFR